MYLNEIKRDSIVGDYLRDEDIQCQESSLPMGELYEASSNLIPGMIVFGQSEEEAISKYKDKFLEILTFDKQTKRRIIEESKKASIRKIA